jgi:hypothetical protein
MTGQEGVARRAMGRRAVLPQGTRFEEVLRALLTSGPEEACDEHPIWRRRRIARLRPRHSVG